MKFWDLEISRVTTRYGYLIIIEIGKIRLTFISSIGNPETTGFGIINITYSRNFKSKISFCLCYTMTIFGKYASSKKDHCFVFQGTNTSWRNVNKSQLFYHFFYFTLICFFFFIFKNNYIGKLCQYMYVVLLSNVIK